MGGSSLYPLGLNLDRNGRSLMCGKSSIRCSINHGLDDTERTEICECTQGSWGEDIPLFSWYQVSPTRSHGPRTLLQHSSHAFIHLLTWSSVTVGFPLGPSTHVVVSMVGKRLARILTRRALLQLCLGLALSCCCSLSLGWTCPAPGASAGKQGIRGSSAS